jgi:hypothetical protein
MPWSSVVAYIVMCLTDLSILGVFVYLIGWKDWSALWMVLAVVLVGGTSFPKSRSGDDLP